MHDLFLGLVLLSVYAGPFVLVGWAFGWEYGVSSALGLIFLLWLFGPIIDPVDTRGSFFQGARRRRHGKKRRA